MRRWARIAAFLLLGIGCCGIPAAAQSPAQQNVNVVVLNVLPQPPQPVKAVRVSLSYLDNSVSITDAQEVTNTQGQALLMVSPGVSQRGDLRVQVTGATGLVIYQPADGQLHALPATVNVNLLPKGSPALLGPAQIEAMLHRSLLEVDSLQKRVSGLMQAQDQKADLGPALAEWAQAMGFPSSQVDSQVQQWAQQIQRDSAQATLQQKALAEVALKHYASAAQLFNQAADSNHDSIDAAEAEEASLEKALLDKVRGQLRQMISNSQQSASASQLNLQYHQATVSMESVEATAATEYKKHPDDNGLHELWLQARSGEAGARWNEGTTAPASQSHALLAQSADDFGSLATDDAALGDRQAAAAAQSALAVVLTDEAERTTGDKARILLNQAAEACQKALDAETKTDRPQDWAQTQVALAGALLDEGERASSDKAGPLLTKAAEAYENALEIYTKADSPQNWAKSQFNFGLTLMEEGDRATGDEAMALFDRAIQAFQKSLEVETKADTPRDWAWTENDLGIALDEEGNRAKGDHAVALFDQAVLAYRSALEVRNKVDLPQDWARTQIYLGNALVDEGARSSGDKAMALFNQGEQAYRSALDVVTKTELPQDWALAETNLGLTLLTSGERSSGDVAAAFLDQAVQALQNALELLTKADLPHEWVAAEAGLVEANFVSSHFADCFNQAQTLTDDVLLWPSLAYYRDVMRLTCATKTGQRAEALGAMQALLAKASNVTADPLDYTGIIHFVSSAPAFATGRPSWVALFTAVQNGDGAGMTAALHQLEPLLQK